MKDRKRRDYLGILLLLVVGLSVGYALLQTTLTINGTSKIKGNTWDIHFANLQVTDGSVSIGTGDVAATIQSSTTDITYTVTLNEPGDFYEFTVDVVNAGTIDGMVESITSKLNNTVITTLPAYLNYSVTYSDGVAIAPNHLLKAGESETYKVRIGFKRDIESTDLPSTAQTLTLDFSVVYVQADDNGEEVQHPRIVYTANEYISGISGSNSVWLGQEYPTTIPYFETPAEALTAMATAASKDVPFYLKHKIENKIVTESYVEFIVTEAMAQDNPGMVPGTYSLRGEKTDDKPNSYVSIYNEANKQAVNTAFGYQTNSSRCNTGSSGYHYYCEVPGLYVDVSTSGYVEATFGWTYCRIFEEGEADCVF